ncbi:MAG: phosphoribosylglycinamide formyltransferase [Polaribacter sp.]|uniref:phosphoribosylglycinamide formyltransferase n=1 Tax=Polaribacter sp. TaxID=1920175 RepID=UPI003BAFA110
MKRIVVFASGSGTNAENIIKFFNHIKTAKVTQVLCNNERAKVFDRCKALNVNCLHFTKFDFYESDKVISLLKEKADYIILAGFLWKVPSKLIDAFPKKIMNIHPALLPKYGGKGMYGIHIHKAVKANNEKETGITIHYVNENYDEGAIIFQAKTALSVVDTPETIAEKIHILEQHYFPRIIEDVIIKINE